MLPRITVSRHWSKRETQTMLPSIRISGWEDWTRVYNDPVVWRPLIDAICVREGIGYRQLEPASANTNAVFLLDRAFVVKIYSPFWDEFDFERTLLEALGAEEEIPTPDLVASGRISDADGVAWCYLITRYCVARPFSKIRRELSDDDATSLVGQLGRIVRALHALDIGRLASAATERIWADVVGERRRVALDELTRASVLDTNIVKPLGTLLDQAIAADQPESRVVVHGDLGTDHVLCAPSRHGWKVEALIDFGDTNIGVREYEWMPLWLGCFDRDPILARAFLDAYEPDLIDDPDFPMRAVAWTLLHDFGADELTRLWRERGQQEPIESIERLQELLCPDPRMMPTA